jgi:hypothetical protein
MASLKRVEHPSGSVVYRVRWRDLAGRPHCATYRTRTEAQKFREGIERAIYLGRAAGRGVTANTRVLLRHILPDE